MIGRLEHFHDLLADADIEITVPPITQVLPESELIEILPGYDGWIIGDDPATAAVFQAGAAGKLRAAVKWGVGIDNVDFPGAHACGIQVTNTPGCFNEEVADVALGFVIMLARKLHVVSNGVRDGKWLKPVGSSLKNKVAAVLGYGNIGRETARRLVACGMKVQAYDPAFAEDPVAGALGEAMGNPNPVTCLNWPDQIGNADYIVLTCALNSHTEQIINAELLEQAKPGVRIVNVSRGPLIDESALLQSLDSGKVESVALEVFVEEPPSPDHPLLNHEACVFGSHNGSNTAEAVDRASHTAIALLREQLESSS